jgi:hypothetical protein
MGQTAVEFLEEKIKKYDVLYFLMCLWFDEAKEIEKQQIIESYCQGCFDISLNKNIFPRETSEQYYNETFNK